MITPRRPALIWFLHFRKARGSSVASLAHRNGETSRPLERGREVTDDDGSIIRLWELSPEGLYAFY